MAEETGVDPSTISKIVQGDTESPNDSTLLKILNDVREKGKPLRKEWLKEGKGEMLSAPTVKAETVGEPSEQDYDSNQDKRNKAMRTNGRRELPLLSKGDLSEVAERDEQIAEREEPLPDKADEYLTVDSDLVKVVDNDRIQAIVEVPGNSMSKTVSGDSRVIVEIEKRPPITQGGTYVWVNDQGCVLITRVHHSDSGTRLVPDNDDYPIIELDRNRDEWRWTCIARVTQVLSGV
jgi:transcriptional regulator with XRE-family HTH domain